MKKVICFLLFSFLSIMAGCKGILLDPSTGETKSSLIIGMTDAPIDEAKEIVVTVTKIEISKDGVAWEEYFNAENEGEQEQIIDLLSYSKGEVFLFDTKEFAAGQYAQIRLYLSEAYILFDGESERTTLDIDSSVTTNGVTVASGFELEEGVTTELTIDFDMRKSIVKQTVPTLQYSLKPNLRLVTNNLSGNIIVTEDIITVQKVVYFLYPAGYDVSGELTEDEALEAINGGDENAIAYKSSSNSAISYIDFEGDGLLKVFFSFMPFGSYDLYELDPSIGELITPAKQINITISADDSGSVVIPSPQ